MLEVYHYQKNHRGVLSEVRRNTLPMGPHLEVLVYSYTK